MNKNLEVKKYIPINGTTKSVWDAMTNPPKIVLYLYGTQTTTACKMEIPITFEGQYEEHPYKDKGVINIDEPTKKLSYTYWSSISGLEDFQKNTLKQTTLSNKLLKVKLSSLSTKTASQVRKGTSIQNPTGRTCLIRSKET